MVADSFEFTPKLLSMVEPVFANLLHTGRFKLFEGTYYPEHFGNEILIFRSSACRLKFTLDRSRIAVDITGPPPVSEWLDLQYFLNVVLGREATLQPYSLEQQAHLLMEHYEEALNYLTLGEFEATEESVRVMARRTSDLRVAAHRPHT